MSPSRDRVDHSDRGDQSDHADPEHTQFSAAAPGPLCASTPLARALTNGHRASDDHYDALNGNVHVNVVSESTSMDVLSGGESDAADTLSRRNNNSITSVVSRAAEGAGAGAGAGGAGAGCSRRRRSPPALTYCVAKELLLTERTHKRDLEMVTVTWSTRLSELSAAGGGGGGVGGGGGEQVAPLARACLALGPLALAHGKLLARLERALAAHPHAHADTHPDTHSDTHSDADSDEPEYNKIAELLYDHLSNNYDAYVQYSAGAGALVALVESVRRRGARGGAGAALAAFELAAPLPLPALLLRPLHRLLYYADLVHEVPGWCAGVAALPALGARLAALARQQLRHVENHAALCQLQRDIHGYDRLLVAEREFLRLGCVYRHSARGLQQRMLFLFNDVALLCSRTVGAGGAGAGCGGGGGGGFRALSAWPLAGLQLHAADAPNTFTLTGEGVNVTLSASNEHEYSGWVSALREGVRSARRAPDDCALEAGGAPGDGDEAGGGGGAGGGAGGGGGGGGGGGLAHVCWHRGVSLTRDLLHLAMRSQLSGYLLRKFKNSHGWQKLWVVFAGFTLFFYKGWQDERPLASLPLLGYSVGPPAPSDGIHKEFVMKLQFKNHVYFFRADSRYTYSRWTEVLQLAMVHRNANNNQQ